MYSHISALVCVKNSEKTLELTLISILNENIKNIVVIDGLSKDKSKLIGLRYTNNVYSDEGKGLGYARQMGVSKINSKYLLIMGPDDILAKDSISEAVKFMEENPKFAGILAHKRMHSLDSIWNKGQDQLYQLASKKNIRVIGNPSLYRLELLKKFEYDPFFNANEDTDICERWWRSGYSVGWGPQSFKVFESLDLSRLDVKGRYNWYGRGDLDFIIKWWKISKKVALRHLCHPFMTYLVKNVWFFTRKFKFSGLVFTSYAGFQRISGLLAGIMRRIYIK